MKLYKTLPLLTLLLIPACGSSSKMTVAAPQGAPAVSLYDRLFDKETEINTADNVQGWLTSGTYDAVIAPTNAGANLIKAGKAPYLLAATVTFGNFFIAATGNDDNGVMDKTDYVVGFQKDGIPDKLFQYVYGTDYNVNYVADNAAAVRALVSGKNEADNNANVDYVLIAQPGMFGALKQNEKASKYADLQTLYKEKTGDKIITQASIFVKKDLSSSKVNSFLDEIETSVTALLNNQSVLDEKLGNVDSTMLASKLGVQQLAVLKAVLKDNSLGIGFKKAYSIKASIDEFLVNLNLGTETSEEIYFK